MSKGRLATNALASIAQVVISALCLLLTYRLLMQYLSIEQIGLWSLVMGSTGVARLSEFGIGSGVTRFIAGDMARGDKRFAALTVGMAVMVIALATTSVLLIAQPYLLKYLLHLSKPALYETVKVLLPTAIWVVILGAIGNVFATALDGFQRMDVRSALQVGGSFVQLVTTWIVLPMKGVNGLGIPQMAQAITMLVGAGAVMVLTLRQPIGAYIGFDRQRLRQMFVYGGGLQINGVVQMLFEPLVKILLTTYGSLSLTGYYEMANRVLLQFRSLVVAGYGALVPHVAARASGDDCDRGEMAKIYCDSMRLLLFIIIPYYTVVAGMLPLGLTVWKGHFDPSFLLMALALHLGWFANTLNPPSYLIYVAIGRLRWTFMTHAIVGVLSVMLGPVLGMLLGGNGVVLATVIALTVGSSSVIFRFHHEFGVRWSDFVKPRHLVVVLAPVAAVVTSGSLALLGHEPSLVVLAGNAAVFALLALIIVWFDPMRRQLVRQALDLPIVARLLRKRAHG